MIKMLRLKISPALALGLFLLTLGQAVPAHAQARATENVPKIVLSGLDAYKAEGADAAIRAWIKGSPIDGSKDALSQANVLRQIQDFYGSYKTFDIISTRDLSPSIKIIYLALNYEKGPLFAKFVVYQTDQGWILTSFNFNTKEDLILPASA
jgi:hypothetical protein